MKLFEKTSFGNVYFDGKRYGDVLVVGEVISERDRDRLKELFGSSHTIGDWELTVLTEDQPEVVVIGTGQRGVLKVKTEVRDFFNSRKIELRERLTPRAIHSYNKLLKEGKKVNALIHTTC